MLEHALDVDVGVFASEATEPQLREFVTALSLLGLRLSHRFGVLNDSFELFVAPFAYLANYIGVRLYGPLRSDGNEVLLSSCMQRMIHSGDTMQIFAEFYGDAHGRTSIPAEATFPTSLTHIITSEML